MKIKTTLAVSRPVLIAAALALLSQSAWSDQEEVRVTSPRMAIEIAQPKIATDAQAYIDALKQRLAEDLAKSLEAISASRIELVIAEAPTRG